MDRSDLLMRSGVAAGCADCGDERLFVPADDAGTGEFCCTACDAAVFLPAFADSAPLRRDVSFDVDHPVQASA